VDIGGMGGRLRAPHFQRRSGEIGSWR
jgi:hypothetical protein